MRCSVVIPCHNGIELTRACLDSLASQRPGPPAEVLLVDNASTDDTARLDGVQPWVRVLRQSQNLGFAAGVNRGILAAREPWILILNNDTRAAPNLLLELRAAMETDPRIAAAAPVSNHVKGPAMLPIGQVGRDEGQRALIAQQLGMAHAPLQDVDTLAGLCLLLRRTTFDEVGLFDERFGHGNFEDDDLSLRLRLLGHRLVVARRAFLHHEGHATFRAMGLDLATEIERRRAQFDAKWRCDPAGRATIAARSGDLAGAALAAFVARRVWPSWPDADWFIARWRAACGEHAEAARHARSLLRACPRHSEAAIELGCALLAMNDAAAARRHLGATVHSFHLDVQQQVRLLTRLGEHAYRAGRHDEAADDFAAARSVAPTDGSLDNWIGLCRLAAGAHADATREFTAAVDKGFGLAHTNLGISLHHQGRAAQARAHFARAVELAPHDPAARANHAAVQGSATPAVVSR